MFSFMWVVGWGFLSFYSSWYELLCTVSLTFASVAWTFSSALTLFRSMFLIFRGPGFFDSAPRPPSSPPPPPKQVPPFPPPPGFVPGGEHAEGGGATVRKPPEIIQNSLNRTFCSSCCCFCFLWLGGKEYLYLVLIGQYWKLLVFLWLVRTLYLSLTLWLVFLNVSRTWANNYSCHICTVFHKCLPEFWKHCYPLTPCWVLRSILLSLWHFLNGRNSTVYLSALIGQYYYLFAIIYSWWNYISFLLWLVKLLSFHHSLVGKNYISLLWLVSITISSALSGWWTTISFLLSSFMLLSFRHSRIGIRTISLWLSFVFVLWFFDLSSFLLKTTSLHRALAGHKYQSACSAWSENLYPCSGWPDLLPPVLWLVIYLMRCSGLVIFLMRCSGWSSFSSDALVGQNYLFPCSGWSSISSSALVGQNYLFPCSGWSSISSGALVGQNYLFPCSVSSSILSGALVDQNYLFPCSAWSKQARLSPLL